MMAKKNQRKWRNSHQLAGVQSQVQRAINTCKDGAYVEIDYKTALNVIDIIEQAKHTEIAHEPEGEEF